MGQNPKGALFSLIAFALFATHDVIIKVLGASYSPFQIIFFATLFSFPLATFLLMRDRTVGTLRPVHPWWTLLRTCCAAIATICAFYAFSVLPLAQTYAIIFAAPLLITLLSIPVLGEQVGWYRGLAVLVGLAGVLIVLRPGQSELQLGHFAAMGTAVFSALASVIVRKIGRDERPVVLVLYPLVINFVIASAMLPFVYQPLPGSHLAGLAALSLLSFSAMYLMIAAYRAAEAAVVAPMQYSQIIWAIFYGMLWFDETLDQPTMIGAAVIILSGLFIVARETMKGPDTKAPVTRTRSRGHGMAFRISALLRSSREASQK